MALHCQQVTVVVIEQQTFLSQHLQQCFDLSILELDNLLLALVDPAAEGREQNVPRLEDERR